MDPDNSWEQIATSCVIPGLINYRKYKFMFFNPIQMSVAYIYLYRERERERDREMASVRDHQPSQCLFINLFGRETINLQVTGPLFRKPPLSSGEKQ